MLESAGNIGITRTTAASNHNVFSIEHALCLVLHNGNDIVSILEVSQPVDILDFLVTQVDASHPIHRLDVVLYGLGELRPVDLDTFGLLEFPAIRLRVLKL